MGWARPGGWNPRHLASVARIDLLNIALMIGSLGAAYLVPFEMVLGPGAS